MKVSTKLYLGVILQFLVAISLVAVFFHMQEKQDHDSIVINLAGRQRMLSQKMTKEILLFSQGVFTNENVLNTIEVFHRTLQALIYGGKAPLDLVRTKFTTLPPPDTRTVISQLKAVESRWSSFSESAKAYLNDKNAASLNYLMDNNILLLQEMNKAVFLMDKAAAGKVAALRKVLILGSTVLLLLFLLTLFIVRKNVQIIFEELKESYAKVKRLNHAKDCVIHHLSHELKTPTSILDASLKLLQKRLPRIEGQAEGCQKILERARKNLGRLLEMQYEIGDMLRKNDDKVHYLLSMLLDSCADELEVLVSESLDEKDILMRLRRRIDELFGSQESVSKEIQLGEFVTQKFDTLRPKFVHNRCRINTHISATAPVWIPSDVLGKIVEALVRNAIENTPAGGRVDLVVRTGEKGPEFEVKDNGVGITEENLRLIFENYFTAYEPMQYSSGNPYEFNAGGKGIDLLRIRIFSELYHFKIHLTSKRCSYIAQKDDICPGDITKCNHHEDSEECPDARGTTVTVQFLPAHRLTEKEHYL
ncbi:MAG: type IV pili methyl-accepting chemotaxis transducer N-terminal domain-containing protein [Deltaproteobacteria bacterium]|jgi:signal transduction histidine kinase|nr:type IV pili methyl-accepting chemotaxis transducer N-terminal domain-containing protein [Deltaproteobacteria bacterium]